MAYALRAERRGEVVHGYERSHHERGGFRFRVPARALGSVVEEYIQRQLSNTYCPDDADINTTRELVAKTLGTTARTVYAWRSGERIWVGLDMADRILLALGLNWWEVWDEPEPPAVSGSAAAVLNYIADVEEHLMVRCAFEGDDDE